MITTLMAWCLALGVFFVAVYQVADFLDQAERWSWIKGFNLNRSKDKWGFWDFIPHDPWHIVQTAGHAGLWVGITLVGYFSYETGHAFRTAELIPLYTLCVSGLVYAITRFVFFTIPMWVAKGG